MPKTIKVENLSKAYQLGAFGTGTISRDLERFWARIRGKEDPFLRIGEVNDRAVKGQSNVVWSLKDLNFEVEQGDAVGIIGRNGAGKSTLLKILSRVTAPTTGSAKVKGRVASLLEVGTGFHPELSGRENIFLNGAILGMRKAEIRRKFDEIVDFSGVERYIDTPVKRYSSGMYVRLAFAVAAHLESEIMIVDEVLAVGDAEFQKKCIGKMGDVSKGEGRTVLFVSHNMVSMEAICNSGILLDNGLNIMEGDMKKVAGYYLNNLAGNNHKQSLSDYLAENGNKSIKLEQVLIDGQSEASVNVESDTVNFMLKGHSTASEQIDVELYLTHPVSNVVVFFCSLYYTQGKVLNVEPGSFEIGFDVGIPANIYSGVFDLSLMITRPGSLYLYKIENLYQLNISGKPCNSGKKYSIDDNVGFAYLDVNDISYKRQ